MDLNGDSFKTKTKDFTVKYYSYPSWVILPQYWY